MECARSELLLAGNVALEHEQDAPVHLAAAMFEDYESTSAGATSHVGSDDEADGGLDLSMCPSEGPCTAMVKNIHYKSTQESIMQTLDALGFQGKYDAIYAPGNPARKTNLGYAFVNFLATDDLIEFHRLVSGRPFDGAPAAKLCTVIVSAVQGIRGPKSAPRKKSSKRTDAVEPLFVPQPLATKLSSVLEHWGVPATGHPEAAAPAVSWGRSLPAGFREPPGLERFGELPEMWAGARSIRMSV